MQLLKIGSKYIESSSCSEKETNKENVALLDSYFNTIFFCGLVALFIHDISFSWWQAMNVKLGLTRFFAEP